MLIRYSYKDDSYFYKEHSNIIPRVGETIIFHPEDTNYANYCHDYKYKIKDGIQEKIELNEYIIDALDDEVFVVDNVCYIIGDETIVDIIVKGYHCYKDDREDYFNNLAKDVNVPNAYNS